MSSVGFVRSSNRCENTADRQVNRLTSVGGPDPIGVSLRPFSRAVSCRAPGQVQPFARCRASAAGLLPYSCRLSTRGAEGNTSGIPQTLEQTRQQAEVQDVPSRLCRPATALQLRRHLEAADAGDRLPAARPITAPGTPAEVERKSFGDTRREGPSAPPPIESPASSRPSTLNLQYALNLPAANPIPRTVFNAHTHRGGSVLLRALVIIAWLAIAFVLPPILGRASIGSDASTLNMGAAAVAFEPSASPPPMVRSNE